MNTNVSALATVLRKKAGELSVAWNRAKSHCSADGDKKNYVRAFKILLMMSKWQGKVEALPERSGDKFFFMGKKATLLDCSSPFCFVASVDDSTLTLPLINLIFCTNV